MASLRCAAGLLTAGLLAAAGCSHEHGPVDASGAGSAAPMATSFVMDTGGSRASSTSAASSDSASSGGAGGAGGFGGSTATMYVDPSMLDQDGDGWTPAEGDCCDVPSVGCAEPALVNPGAFEYPGNGVDDDCDPSTPDDVSPPSCSPAPRFGGVTGAELIEAMDLCQFTTESPVPSLKKWGVISADLVLADGTTPLPALSNAQVGVLAAFGSHVSPTKNATMAALSSGTARAPSDPGYVHPQNGSLAGQIGNYNGGTQVTIQSRYLTPHDGRPPSPASCTAACTSGCDQAFDSVDLRARIRVPTNAQGFSYQFKFYSAEFPEYVCNKYNDFFVALLSSSWTPTPKAMPPETPLPADGNIALDAQGNPVSVNNGFFQVCFPPFGAPAGTCPSGTLELADTGMGGWGTNLTDGGGTDWLTNEAPVVPGETIEIEFVIWDAGDHNVDSLVLLDHFRWSITPSPLRVHK